MPLPPSRLPTSPWSLGRSLGIVLLVGLVAWWGAWHGAFVFDDHPAIEDNEALRAGDWWSAAFAPPHQPLANRPLATLSLALDFWLFGVGPFGPHLTNVLLQLGNGAVLLLLLRRLLRAPNLAGSWAAAHADGLALAIATIWVAHPLAADAVAYATQRSTLLFSGCLLLGLWATLRGRFGLVVLAFAAGMASKEDFVVAPLLLPLFVRAFVLPDWRALAAWRSRFVVVAATWSVLVACVWLGPSNATVGAGNELQVTAWQWLCTQASVVLQYLRLALVPWPQRGAYDWDFVRDCTAAIVPGVLVLALLAATVVAWRRRPWLGFCGAWFFLLLAPTSSVLPIVTEVVAERRAYLPMLAVLVPVLLLVARHLPARVLMVAALLVVAVLGARGRVAAYADEPSFWADAFAKRTPGCRSHLAAQILSNHGAMLFSAGNVEAAARLFDEAMSCEAPTIEERLHHAVSLQVRGRTAEGLAALEQLAHDNPDHAESHGSLGTALLQGIYQDGAPKVDDPRLPRAEAALRRALELSPRRQAFWNSLGVVHELRQHWQQAEAAFRRATELGQERIEPFVGRARMLARLGRGAEIQPMFDALFQSRPDDVNLRLLYVNQLLQNGDRARAATMLREVLRIDPNHAEAAAALRQLGQ
ncbi:MAG: tetratricopeptide repeat protein [Planctomycetes bacterium]|nr:tetratricopeptide repeat protein [Planctomycetota bacterium]MCC7397732.1 tetratricopeptide repeat protein [Planctomycetota bacterium]